MGVRAIDGLLTCCQGQRLGIFSGAGVGKSVLLGMIARNTEAEINAILAENRVAIAPTVILTPGGMTFKLDLVPSAQHLKTDLPNGSGGDKHGG